MVLIFFVPPAGFEPATPSLKVRCSKPTELRRNKKGEYVTDELTPLWLCNIVTYHESVHLILRPTNPWLVFYCFDLMNNTFFNLFLRLIFLILLALLHFSLKCLTISSIIKSSFIRVEFIILFLIIFL